MKKLISFLVIFFTTIIITISCYAKYIYTNENIIANIKIDAIEPQINLEEITNTNKKYPNYANETYTITAIIKVTEKNIIENNFNKNNVKVLINETEIANSNYEIEKIKQDKEEIFYKITIKNLTGNGKLKIKVKNGTIIDMGEQANKEKIFDTNIIIDNIAPVTTFEQEEKSDGKVTAKVVSNEPIQEINAWDIFNNTIVTKEFECNVTYPLTITDYAGNSTSTIINITKATYIKIRYGTINEDALVSFGYGNGDAAGKESVLSNPKNRTELINFCSEGGIEKDFIQYQAYAHTYWGEGTRGKCYSFEHIYNSGYNPGADTFSTLQQGTLAMHESKVSVMLGGRGMNRANNKGLGGKAIPEDISKQHLFGISSLKIKLKDTSKYSIVYQIWVQEKGWLEAEADGVETTYAHDKPIGAFRMALIPKTEKQYLIDYWNKDIGTNLF